MKKKLNILHVDDSRAIILYIKAMLMEVPAIETIESAGTISEAQQYLTNNNGVDVVILDVNLPDGNGFTMLEWIKQHYPSMIVIMFTNNSDSFFRGVAEKTGADFFLDKSMEFDQLITTLNSL